ncbi:g10803 [Coccomyxa elongata]
MAEQVENIKWVPNTPFIVDGFRFQTPRCKHYWLSHYHSDHTIGLSTSFSAGTIYCSKVTANLLVKDMRINPSCIQPLPLDTPLLVDGVHVTLIDANHCPGAVLFLFKTPAPLGSEFPEQVILHTGDMRWHPRMGRHAALAKQRIDMLFLDTTYASPKHVFPCQEDAIADIVKVMRKERKAHLQTLFIVGSYRIGKERAYLGAAKALGWKVYVNADKLRVLRLLGLPEADMALLTKDAAAAQIHVSFMGKLLTPDALTERIRGTKWTHVVAFRPTGWSFQKSGLSCRREGDVAIYGIPYSEHSSFAELRDCIKTLRPRRIVPTVNASTPAAARLLVDRFADLMDLSKDRSRLDFFLRKAKTAPPATASSAAPTHVTEGSDIAIDEAAALAATAQDLFTLSKPDTSAAACRAVSAPADLAADLDPEGVTRSNHELEAEWDCCDPQEECGSKAYSEWGEDTGADMGADVGQADANASAAVNDLEEGTRDADAGRQDLTTKGRVWQEGALKSCDGEQSGRHAARRAAELVHLGLSSPPDVDGQLVECPIAAAAEHNHDHGPLTDTTARAGAAQIASGADAAWSCGDVTQAQGCQRDWPLLGESPADSAADSWSSDSWDSAAARSHPEAEKLPSREAAGRMQRPHEQDTDRRSESRLLTPEEHQPAQLQSITAVPRPDGVQHEHAGSCGAEEPPMGCAEVRSHAGDLPESSPGEEDDGTAVPKAGVVDLAAVDVAEQERILRAIQLQRRAQQRVAGGADGGARKRGQGAAAGGSSISLVMGSQTKRRQLSIGAFIMKAPTSKH